MSIMKFAIAIFTFVLVFSLADYSDALEYTPISDDFVSKIQTEFTNGVSPDLNILAKRPSWSCELYGMRSRKQSQKQKDFYKFSPPANNFNVLANDGSQSIPRYFKKKKELRGKAGSLHDYLRMSPGGEYLVGEVSIPDRGDGHERVASLVASNRTVIAYTLCK